MSEIGNVRQQPLTFECGKTSFQEYEFEGQEDDGEDTEDLESNIKDLEFKLTHDLDKVQVSNLILKGYFLFCIALLMHTFCGFNVKTMFGNFVLLQDKHTGLSRRDINLLKIIICSGLFPQVAISDEHNSFKPDSEQAFHTKVSADTPPVILNRTSEIM